MAPDRLRGGDVRRRGLRRRWSVTGLVLERGEQVIDVSEVEPAPDVAAVAAATTDALVLLQGGQVVWRRPWHELDQGTWDPDERVLHLTAVDGWEARLHLPAQGRLALPVAVRDRVQSSVVATRFVPVGDRSVRVVVRQVHGGSDAGRLVVQEVVPPGLRVTDAQTLAVRRTRRELEELVGLPVTGDDGAAR